MRVPDAISVSQMPDEAVREDVSFAPEAIFFPELADQPYIRMNYASHTEEEIDRGVSVLGRLLHRQLARRDANGADDGLVAQ